MAFTRVLRLKLWYLCLPSYLPRPYLIVSVVRYLGTSAVPQSVCQSCHHSANELGFELKVQIGKVPSKLLCCCRFTSFRGTASVVPCCVVPHGRTHHKLHEAVKQQSLLARWKSVSHGFIREVTSLYFCLISLIKQKLEVLPMSRERGLPKDVKIKWRWGLRDGRGCLAQGGRSQDVQLQWERAD